MDKNPSISIQETITEIQPRTTKSYGEYFVKKPSGIIQQSKITKLLTNIWDFMLTDPNEAGDSPYNIGDCWAQIDNDTLYFKTKFYTQWGNPASDFISPAIFIDADRNPSTGYDGSFGYHTNDIGAEYLLAPLASTNILYWNGTDWADSGYPMYSYILPNSDSIIIGVALNDIGNPYDMDIVEANIDETTGYFDYAPDSANGHITLYQDDIELVSIDSFPYDYVNPNTAIPLYATATNHGLQEDSFNIICLIDSSGSIILGSNVFIPSLLPDSSIQVFMCTWNTGPLNSQYNIKMWTTLSTDSNYTNDTLGIDVTTFDLTRNISSSYANTVPTIDGLIAAIEWTDAVKRDVTDVLGKGGALLPPGQVYLYIMNDDSFLYLGIDAIYDVLNDDEDAFWQCYDDNGDTLYPAYPDSSEGELDVDHYIAGDILSFCPEMSDSSCNTFITTAIQEMSSLASGHMQYEIAIPINTSLIEGLQANMGDVFRMWFFTGDGSDYTIFGWWPTTAHNGWGDLDDMGEITLATASGINFNKKSIKNSNELSIYCSTINSFKNEIYFSYNIPSYSNVTLNIYNSSGQMIKSIINENKIPGKYTTKWNTCNNDGIEVPSGIYFYMLEVDNNKVPGKMILIK